MAETVGSKKRKSTHSHEESASEAQLAPGQHTIHFIDKDMKSFYHNGNLK